MQQYCMQRLDKSASNQLTPNVVGQLRVAFTEFAELEVMQPSGRLQEGYSR
jgi:hypothetical protein